jgi:hypothetical protein
MVSLPSIRNTWDALGKKLGNGIGTLEKQEDAQLARETTSQRYTRDQGLKFKSNFDRRGLKLTNCTDWPANGNVHSCRWCAYGPVGLCPDYVPYQGKKK